MREGIYLERLENTEKALNHNIAVLGTQLTRLHARLGAIEEMFVTGPEASGFILKRLLIFKNGLLTLFAPGIVAKLLTHRENAMVASMKQLAEQRFLEKMLEKQQAKQAAQKKPEQSPKETITQ